MEPLILGLPWSRTCTIPTVINFLWYCVIFYYINVFSADCQCLDTTVSDNIVMSSLKTCNMNCGSHWEGRGRVGSKGWAVDHQPGTSVDGHSHHDHQKGDFQVSKKGWFNTQRDGKRAQGEAKGGNWLTEQYS